MRKKPFDEQIYKEIAINNLIILSIYLIIQEGKGCTFEELVKTCFSLFPKTFALSKYPKWPDARKLDRPLRTLREKDLISGSPQNTFSLTKKGKKIALELAKIFRQKKLL
jgi:hypothetical protein